MYSGNVGQMLDVNLSTQQVRTIDLDPKIIRNFVGGLGLGVKILYDEVGPDVEALSPSNIIVVAPGPLTGTHAPTNSRTEVITKSPLTESIGLGNFGGFFGPKLRFAGFEAIVIRGKSDSPVLLWIDDDWPAMFYEEPFPAEPFKGALLSRDEVNRLLDDYYDLRGWDRETGIPTRKTLTELDLDYVADELAALGFIPA